MIKKVLMSSVTIKLAPSNCLYVVPYAFSQSEEKDDWRRTTIFTHTLRREELESDSG